MAPEVIFAPDVPDKARRSIERFPEYWQRRSEPLEVPDRRDVLRGTLKGLSARAWEDVLLQGMPTGVFVFFIVGMITAILHEAGVLSAAAGWWLSGGLGMASMLVLATESSKISVEMRFVPLFPNGRDARRVRACHGRYVAMKHLDGEEQRLFERAREACEAVVEARVHRDGLLDGIANPLILDDELWHLAERLEHESFLGSSLRELESREPVPELESVLKRQRRAVGASRAVTSAKVEALERYAGQVRTADSVYLASLQAARDEEFLALTARTDDTTALASLDDTATALHRALKDVHAALLSFESHSAHR